MKRILMLIIALAVLLGMTGTVSAQRNDRNHDDRRGHHQRYYDDDRRWHRTHDNDRNIDRNLPFRWRGSIRERHHLEPIHEREWDRRFPGYRAYRWHGSEGFWHHGHYIKDAVLFYNERDELVSIGYMFNGVFIHFREDHECYENRDSFFLSWWGRR